FKKYVEYGFTANLENELDDVADGKANWKALLQNFWTGFNDNISTASEQKTSDVIKYVEDSLSTHLFGKDADKNRACSSCKDGQLNLKLGKFGAFLACSNYPDCNFKKQISSADKNAEGEGANISPENNNRLLGQDQSGVNVHLKKG